MPALSVAGTAPGLSAQTEIHRWADSTGFARFGFAVAPAGDIDGDGRIDVLIGAPGDRPPTIGADNGSCKVFSSSDGRLLLELFGGIYEGLGVAVSPAGDLNGDGVPDFAAGAYGVPVLGEYVRAFSGRDGSVLFTTYSLHPGDGFGRSISWIGDVSGDGVPDLVVGAPLANPVGVITGAIHLVSGADGSVFRTQISFSAIDHELFGISVTGLGDLTGDGVAEYAAGAPDWSALHATPGRVFVYSGATGAILQVYSGRDAGDHFGNAINRAGDVDADGVEDLVVGALADSDFFPYAGSVWVFSGATGSLIHEFHGDQSDSLGTAVGSGWDMDGDGAAEIIAAADSNENAVSSGSVWVFSGATATVLYRLFGESDRAYSGDSIASVGDVDGDGGGDFVVGAYGDDSANPDAGMAVLISGWADVPILTISNYSAGALARIWLENLTPSTVAYLGWSMTGRGPTQTGLGEVLLSPPIHRLGPYRADSSGLVATRERIPLTAAGSTLYAQAIGTTASGQFRLSNSRMCVVQ